MNMKNYHPRDYHKTSQQERKKLFQDELEEKGYTDKEVFHIVAEIDYYYYKSNRYGKIRGTYVFEDHAVFFTEMGKVTFTRRTNRFTIKGGI